LVFLFVEKYCVSSFTKVESIKEEIDAEGKFSDVVLAREPPFVEGGRERLGNVWIREAEKNFSSFLFMVPVTGVIGFLLLLGTVVLCVTVSLPLLRLFLLSDKEEVDVDDALFLALEIDVIVDEEKDDDTIVGKVFPRDTKWLRSCEPRKVDDGTGWLDPLVVVGAVVPLFRFIFCCGYFCGGT
jgi:hypothetical protein